MIEQQNTIIVIPARLASRNLPGKPLADIWGVPMVVHVWRRAMEAKIGHVLVAAADLPIAEAVRAAGGDAIMTGRGARTGTDRVAEALAMRDPQGNYSHVVNLEADLPVVDPLSVQRCLAGLTNAIVDISTVAAAIEGAEAVHDPATVKAIAPLAGREVAFARDFLREPPVTLPPPFWQHAGIYAYRRPALDRFAALPQSPRERDLGVEMLRALDNGLKVAVVRIDNLPLRVASPADLEAARIALKEKK
ncbi:MAG: 3-deoxy-manno-octulosonate cytidylyltransferase [Rhizobiales bacterium]|nr:3-deoxy-manno-octulosonate cytidylyltransferase [Hyphomicrobiales bacterium]